MNVRKILSYLCLLPALASMASMRKNEDPIAATAQTAPISYQQKSEEDKDGIKGAPSPSMTFYPNQKFMTNSPVKENKKEEVVEENKASDDTEEQAVEEDDLWESDDNTELKKDQESSKKAVEEEDNWWAEDDSEKPSADSQSDSGF